MFKRACYFSLAVLLTGAVLEPNAQESKEVSLQEAVATAVELNRELRAVRRDQQAAKHGIWEAKSAYLPQISFYSEASDSESELYEFDTPTFPPPYDTLFDFGSFGGFTGTTYTNQFRFSQLIYDRSVIGNIKIARLREEAARWQESGQLQQVVFDTVASYLDVIREQELLGVQQQRLSLAEKQLEVAQSKLEVGLRIRTDVLRAELARSSARRDLVSTEIAMKQAQVLFNRIVGVPLEDRYTFAASGLAQYNPPEAILDRLARYEELSRQAMEQNPSIKVASILIEQQEESSNIARGEFYPRVTAGGQWGYRDQPDPSFESEDWSIRAAVEIPLFEGGRRIAKMRRTTEELEAQRERYEDAVRAVFNAVDQAALSLQEEHRNLQIAIETEEVAKENYERFLSVYEEGLADILDLTEALTELVEAQTNVVTTRYGYMRLYAQLLLAMGIIPTESSSYAELSWLAVVE